MQKPVHLNHEEVIEIKPSTPFAFDPTFHKPDHFTSDDNYWESVTRWQTWNFMGICLGIKFENRGIIDSPKIAIHVYAQKLLSKDLMDSLFSELNYPFGGMVLITKH